MAFTTLPASAACHETSHVGTWLSRLRRAWGMTRIPHVAALDDRAMCDIGLPGCDRARLRHRHPSQHTHHPYG